MKIEYDTVIFKSEPYYFKQERDGLKSNTVQLLTRKEMLQIKPIRGMQAISRIRKIRIECIRRNVDDTCFEPFTRVLTSIEQIGELLGHYLFVFSWRHEELKEEETKR